MCRSLLWVGTLVIAGTAAGAIPLHTGATKYLRIVRLGGGNRTMVLTRLGRRALTGQLNGRVLVATCATLGRPAHGFTIITSEQSESESAPHGGPSSYHSILVPGTDFCAISLDPLNGRGSTGSSTVPPFDSIALDQKGAAYLDEDRVTQRLFDVLQLAIALASRDPHGDFPTAPRLMPFSHGQVIALSSPDAFPPAGRVGVFSDGAGHIEFVALSALGQRLFIDSNAGVLSTNAPEHLIRVVSSQVDTLPG